LTAVSPRLQILGRRPREPKTGKWAEEERPMEIDARPGTSHAIVPSSEASVGMLAVLLNTRSALPELPFQREIVLLTCDVAGTSYVDDTEALEAELAPGGLLTCVREPHNRHDSLAIRLQTSGGHKAGYVPRASNEVIARLMDAGKVIRVRVTEVVHIGSWLKISIEVLLHDL
jgi:hypothetical protein